MELIFEPTYFPIFLIDCLLVGPLHFGNKFDPEHILIETGYHLELEILQLVLFLLDQHLHFLDLRNEGGINIG